MNRLMMLVLLAATGCADSAAEREPPIATYTPPLAPAAETVVATRQRAVREAPLDATGWRTLGATYLADRLFADAATCLEQVVRLDPGDGASWMLLGLAREEAALEGVTDAYAAGISASRPCPAALWRGALAHLEAGQADQAVSLLMPHAGGASGGAMPWLVLGRALLETERPKDAAGVLAKAVSASPEDRYARLLLGKAMQRAGVTGAEANLTLGAGAVPAWRDQWTTAAMTYGVSADARAEVAEAMIKQGRPARAAEVLAQLVDEDPDRIEYRVQLAKAQRSLGQVDEALAAMQGVLRGQPDEHPALTQAAGAAFARWQQSGAKRDLDLALQYLDRAVERTASAGHNWRLRAEVRRAAGDLLGAAEDFERAWTLDAYRPGVGMQGADAYIQAGDPGRALAILDALRPVFPRDVNVLVLSGRARLTLGDRDAAARDAAEAVVLAPDHSGARQLASELGLP